MPNQLTIHTFAPTAGIEHRIRVVEIEGNPWFVGADVCRTLGLRSFKRGFGHHFSKLDADERRLVAMSEIGGRFDIGHPHQTDIGHPRGGLNPHTKIVLVSESGLYKLIFRSDKPEARIFQDWVARVVLPAIFRDGGYVMGEEKLSAAALSEAEQDALITKALELAKRKVERFRAERDQRMVHHAPSNDDLHALSGKVR